MSEIKRTIAVNFDQVTKAADAMEKMVAALDGFGKSSERMTAKVEALIKQIEVSANAVSSSINNISFDPIVGKAEEAAKQIKASLEGIDVPKKQPAGFVQFKDPSSGSGKKSEDETDGIVKSLEKVNSTVEKINNSVNSVSESINNISFETLSQKAEQSATQIKSSLEGIEISIPIDHESVGTATESVISQFEKIGQSTQELKQKLELIIQETGSSVNSISESINNVSFETLTQKIEESATQIKSSLEGIDVSIQVDHESVGKAAQSIIVQFEQIGKSIQELKQKIESVIQEIVSISNSISESINSISFDSLVQKAEETINQIKALKEELFTSGDQIEQPSINTKETNDAIKEIIAALNELKEKSKKVATSIRGVFDRLKKSASELNGVINSISVTKITKSAERTANKIQKSFEEIREASEAMFEGVKSEALLEIGKTSESISKDVRDAFGSIREDTKELSDSFKDVSFEAMNNAADKMSESVSLAFENISEMTDQISLDFEKISMDSITEASDKMSKSVTSAFDDVSNASSNVNAQLNKVGEGLKPAAESIERISSVSQLSRQELLDLIKSIESTRRAKRRMTRSTKEAETGTDLFNKASQNLTKSVQVALGPLSGVAARITAMTALFNKNTISAASLIGIMTGLGVAVNQLTERATESERQMLRMQAVLESMGDAAKFTLGGLEDMAQRLTAGTMAGLNEMREGLTLLSTFGDVTSASFERAAETAYALSRTFGGEFRTNVRQIGRLLEDPLRNMDALRRTGIQFTREERERIQIARDSFQTQEAQNIVLDKFGAIVQIARNETQGLAGAMDSLEQAFDNLFQRLADESSITQNLARDIASITEKIEELTENIDSRAIVDIANIMSNISDAIGKVMKFLSENIQLLTDIFKFLVGVLIAKVVRNIILFSLSILRLNKQVKDLTDKFNTFTSALPPKARAILIVAKVVGYLVGVVLAGGAAMRLLSRQVDENAQIQRDFQRQLNLTNRAIVGLPTEKTIDIKLRIENIEAEQEVNQALIDGMETFIEATNRQISDLETKLVRAMRRRSFTTADEFARLAEMEEEQKQRYMEALNLTTDTPNIAQRLMSNLSLTQASPFASEEIRVIQNSIQVLTDSIDEYTQEINRMRGVTVASTDELRMLEEEAKIFKKHFEDLMGGKSQEQGMEFLTSLRNELDSSAKEAEDFERKMQTLQHIIEHFPNLPDSVKNRLDELGFSLEHIEKLTKELAKTSPDLKGYDQFNEKINEITRSLINAKRELQGLNEIDFKLLDEIKELGSAAREKIVIQLALDIDASDDDIANAYLQRVRSVEAIRSLTSEVNSIESSSLKGLELINSKHKERVRLLNQITDRESREALQIRVEQIYVSEVAEHQAQESEKRRENMLALQNDLINIQSYINQYTMTQEEYQTYSIQREHENRLSDARDYLARYAEMYGLTTEQIALLEEHLTESLSNAQKKRLDELQRISNERIIQDQRGLNEQRLALESELNRQLMSEKEYEIFQIEENNRRILASFADYLTEYARINELTLEEVLRKHEETYEIIIQASEKALENVTKDMNFIEKIASQTGQAMEKAFADFLFDPFSEGLKGMVKSFAVAMQRMISDALAAKIIMNTLGVTSFGSFLGVPAPKVGAFPKNPLPPDPPPPPIPVFAAATGGLVRGPGTETSDSIPAMLSNGEFVIRASAVKKIGVNNLHRLNNFAEGGLVGKMSGSGTAGGMQNNIVINVNNEGGVTEQGSGKELGRKLKEAVMQVIITEKRPGGLLA